MVDGHAREPLASGVERGQPFIRVICNKSTIRHESLKPFSLAKDGVSQFNLHGQAVRIVDAVCFYLQAEPSTNPGRVYMLCSFFIPLPYIYSTLTAQPRYLLAPHA